MHWGKWVSKVAQSCPTLCDHMDGSLPVSCVHGILQARVLEWVAISFSGGSSRLRDRTRSPALQADALPSEPPESYLRQERIELSTDQSWPYCLLTWQVLLSKLPVKVYASVVQSLSCLTLHEPTDCSMTAFLSFIISWSLLKLMSIESLMPSNHLILCHPLLCLPSTFPSIRVFSNESALRIRWPKYWSFSFSISPPSEYSGLISFRIVQINIM